MRRDKLRVAVAEAERFLNRAATLLEIHEQPYSEQMVLVNNYIGGLPREQGAVRRASMDLSRALADLRRNG